MSTHTLTQQIAEKLTAMRRARGMTLADFARELGIGARQLAMIERGQKAVSIRFLLKICRTFRKPLDYFLAGASTIGRPYHSVVRSRDRQLLPRRDRRGARDEAGADHEFRSLTGDFTGAGMHPYYVRTAPRPAGRVTLHEHHGQEFVFVLSGSVTLLTIQDGRHVRRELTTGDTCFIDSSVPHRFLGTGTGSHDEAPAELIDVFWTGLGEEYLFSGRGEATVPVSVVTTSS